MPFQDEAGEILNEALRHGEDVDATLDTLDARDLALECTVSALPAPGENRKDLLSELAALPELPLHPDERNAALLHLRERPDQ